MLSPEFQEKFNSFPNLKARFDGVYSADTLPGNIRKDHFIVCNTDLSSGPGKHWYCILKSERNTLECFDSLGIDDTKKQFLIDSCHFKGIKKIRFNLTAVQCSDTSSCGLFVLYFLIQRCHNKDMSFDDLLNEIFVESKSANEQKVASFCNFHFA